LLFTVCEFQPIPWALVSFSKGFDRHSQHPACVEYNCDVLYENGNVLVIRHEFLAYFLAHALSNLNEFTNNFNHRKHMPIQIVTFIVGLL